MQNRTRREELIKNNLFNLITLSENTDLLVKYEIPTELLKILTPSADLKSDRAAYTSKPTEHTNKAERRPKKGGEHD